MTYKLPPLPDLNRLAPFVGGLGKAILRELTEDVNTYTIAAIEAQGVPDGWQLVPKEPTEALLRPFYGCPPEELPLAWQAMHMVASAMRRKQGESTPPAPQAKPQPLSDPLHDDIQSVLHEIERAIKDGYCPWQIEAAFEAYEAARRLQQPVHGIKE